MTAARRAFRCRAVLHHDNGLSHPDWGRLVAYDRRLSYHRTWALADARRDRIMTEHGSTRRAERGTQVKWIEIERRLPEGGWELVERVRPAPAPAEQMATTVGSTS